MKKILITFSGARFEATTQKIVENAPKFGCDEVRVYDDDWLIKKRPEFIAERKDLFDHKFMRGFGWFCWKPFIIMDALNRCEKGDIVLFTDADTYPIADLSGLFDTCARESGIMLFSAVGFQQRHWCKRDCNILMGMDADKWRDKQAGCARFMLFQKGAAAWRANDRYISSESFLIEWLKYASDIRLTTFSKSVLAEEYPDLQQHRCEQAILTNLAHKYGIPLHREASGEGNAILDKEKRR